MIFFAPAKKPSSASAQDFPSRKPLSTSGASRSTAADCVSSSSIVAAATSSASIAGAAQHLLYYNTISY